MEAVLPPFFITLAGLGLLMVLFSLRRSVAVLLSRPGAAAALGTGDERDALLAEKRALLQTVRDLGFEHETGKLSDEDFERLNATYRARAKDVLRKLDAELSEYRAEAKALIAAELGGGSSEAQAQPADADAADDLAELDAAACADCGTTNDADAVFCKKCGARLAVAVDAAGEEAAP